VDTDGTVIFDSHADAGTMENHADREEIKEALVSGTGSSTRHSSTLTEQTIYEATRLNDGSVLRISVSRATALVLVLGMLQPIAIVLVIAIALSAWLAHRMAKKVVEPLNKLDLDKPMENESYEGMTPFSVALTHSTKKSKCRCRP
jgi:two-component system phosphate regulon sensor histidine kinase PhoR